MIRLYLAAPTASLSNMERSIQDDMLTGASLWDQQRLWGRTWWTGEPVPAMECSDWVTHLEIRADGGLAHPHCPSLGIRLAIPAGVVAHAARNAQQSQRHHFTHVHESTNLTVILGREDVELRGPFAELFFDAEGRLYADPESDIRFRLVTRDALPIVPAGWTQARPATLRLAIGAGPLGCEWHEAKRDEDGLYLVSGLAAKLVRDREATRHNLEASRRMWPDPESDSTRPPQKSASRHRSLVPA